MHLTHSFPFTPSNSGLDSDRCAIWNLLVIAPVPPWRAEVAAAGMSLLGPTLRETKKCWMDKLKPGDYPHPPRHYMEWVRDMSTILVLLVAKDRRDLMRERGRLRFGRAGLAQRRDSTLPRGVLLLELLHAMLTTEVHLASLIFDRQGLAYRLARNRTLLVDLDCGLILRGQLGDGLLRILLEIFHAPAAAEIDELAVVLGTIFLVHLPAVYRALLVGYSLLLTVSRDGRGRDRREHRQRHQNDEK